MPDAQLDFATSAVPAEDMSATTVAALLAALGIDTSHPLAVQLGKLDFDTADADLEDTVLEVLSHTEGGYLPLLLLADEVAATMRHGSLPTVASAIAGLCTQPADDKRRKSTSRLHPVAGVPFVVLTSTGWTRLGQPNRRESNPTEGRVTHSLALHNVARWLRQQHLPAHASRDVVGAVLGSSEVRHEYGARMEHLRFDRDHAQERAALAGGLYPDLMLRTNWPHTAYADRLRVWPGADVGADADMSVAIEVELSEKSAVGITTKLRRHEAAISLGWHHAVVWVVGDADTYKVLTRSAAAISAPNVVRWMIPASHIGHGSEFVPEKFNTWSEHRWLHSLENAAS
jgi:hypothetical protein